MAWLGWIAGVVGCVSMVVAVVMWRRAARAEHMLWVERGHWAAREAQLSARAVSADRQANQMLAERNHISSYLRMAKDIWTNLSSAEEAIMSAGRNADRRVTAEERERRRWAHARLTELFDAAAQPQSGVREREERRVA